MCVWGDQCSLIHILHNYMGRDLRGGDYCGSVCVCGGGGGGDKGRL